MGGTVGIRRGAERLDEGVDMLTRTTLGLAMAAVLLTAGTPHGASGTDQDAATLEQRYLIALVRTQTERGTAEQMRELQAGHLANIRRMAEAGHLLVAGPTSAPPGAPSDLAGLLVFKAPSPELIEQVEAMLADDPLIEAGYLEARPHVFFFTSGESLYSASSPDQENGSG